MSRILLMATVETQSKRILLLFDGFPDEIVLIILPYGTIKDIQRTRVWQTANVQQSTVNDIEKRSCRE